jgi:hypothetical protein
MLYLVLTILVSFIGLLFFNTILLGLLETGLDIDFTTPTRVGMSIFGILLGLLIMLTFPKVQISEGSMILNVHSVERKGVLVKSCVVKGSYGHKETTKIVSLDFPTDKFYCTVLREQFLDKTVRVDYVKYITPGFYRETSYEIKKK